MIFLGILIGIILGIFTGLMPGIHINLLSVILINIYTSYSLNKEIFFFVILSMSLTHTFFNAFPSILLGVPDSESIFNVLAGHKFVLKGEGKKAIWLTLIGSFSGILFAIPIFLIISNLNSIPDNNYIKLFVFLIILSTMVLKNEKSLRFIILFGSYGYFFLNLINLNEPLFHIFSGIFALAPIISSIKNNVKIPNQKELKKNLKTKHLYKIPLTILFSILTLTFPGISTSIGLMFLFMIIKTTDELYLILTGAMDTITMFLAIPFYYSFGYKRNGSIIALSELKNSITESQLIKLLLLIITISYLIYEISKLLIDKIINFLQKLNYLYLNITIISVIFIISFILDSFIGLICLVIGLLLGLYLLKEKAPRYFAMNVIFIPVIYYSLLTIVH
ncbi:MAG: tripartite tricarboxylate transporter permease [Candidatus Woesearchaeota archaeon]